MTIEETIVSGSGSHYQNIEYEKWETTTMLESTSKQEMILRHQLHTSFFCSEKNPNGPKKETSHKEITNQEESRKAHLSQLWREDIFLCVEEMYHVIFQTYDIKRQWGLAEQKRIKQNQRERKDSQWKNKLNMKII